MKQEQERRAAEHRASPGRRRVNDDAPARRGRAGVYGGGIVVGGSTARGLTGPRLGHQVESNVPGRCTGGISRTVGRV
jgi:hypothetical protein